MFTPRSTTSSQRTKSEEGIVRLFSETLASLCSLREDDFPGFKDPPNFGASVAVLLTFALTTFLLSLFPYQACGVLAVPSLIIMSHWYRRHGMKLTRREAIFFDEMNLLDVAPNFEYDRPPILEGTTPASGPERDPPGPTSIWEALFADDRKLEMQRFYQEHYGPVYHTAKRRYKEFIQLQKDRSELAKTSFLNQPPDGRQ